MKKNISEASAELLKTGLAHSKSADLLTDARAIIDAAQKSAYRSVNAALVYRNWLLGRRIAEEDLGGETRAEYGSYIIDSLSTSLSGLYGEGFDRRSLYMFLKFYRRFPILDSLSPKSGGLLSWTHYKKPLQVEANDALLWYRDETARGLRRHSGLSNMDDVSKGSHKYAAMVQGGDEERWTR